MSKKAVSIVLAILLTAAMVGFSALSLSAQSEEPYYAGEASVNNEYYEKAGPEEEGEVAKNAAEISENPDEAPSAQAVTATAPQPEVVDFPYLTVNAISNLCPKATSEYNDLTKEIVVTYLFKSTRDILNTQWTLTYDSSVLSYSSKNTKTSICPSMGGKAAFELDEKNGVINFNSSSLKLFDFSTQEKIFAKVIFDINDLPKTEPVTTTIDLTVSVLKVSRIDPQTGFSDFDQEIALVNNFEINKSREATSVSVSHSTTLTPSTFVPPTTAPPATPDQAISTAPSTQQITTLPHTVPAKASTPDSVRKKNGPPALISPGSSTHALIFLSVTIVSTTILFIIRKKELETF
ncbi:MAG: hypothetical protein U0K87_03960 [Ruminococcus sp.]|nr:hypothetical protein [Ruminococcus sp.]